MKDLQKHQENTDKYKIKKVIGEGAYGLVFKATCTKSKSKVAIKYIDLIDANKKILTLICREFKINQFLSLYKGNIFTPRLLDAYIPIEDREGDAEQLSGIYLVFEFISFSLNDFI